MDRKLRIVQYGCGNMSRYLMRYVYEKGAEVVGAIDMNPDLIGKDIGEIMKTEKKGVLISSKEEAKELLENVKPDACIVATKSLLKDVKESLLLCAELGIDTITTCEEAFFPWNSNPNLTAEIDAIARAHHCTITGSGFHDVYCGQLISSLGGSIHEIKKIIGVSSYNIEDYGLALAEAHGAGLTPQEFDQKIASVDRMSEEERKQLIDSGTYSPSYRWNVNGWLAKKFGLTVKNQTQICVPETYQEDIFSTTLGKIIKSGDVTGMNAVVTTDTVEGILLETKCIGKVYAPNETDMYEWSIIGEPSITIEVKNISTAELTCASVVNRIPDLINARSGFVPTTDMGNLEYRTEPLHTYVKKRM